MLLSLQPAHRCGQCCAPCLASAAFTSLASFVCSAEVVNEAVGVMTSWDVSSLALRACRVSPSFLTIRTAVLGQTPNPAPSTPSPAATSWACIEHTGARQAVGEGSSLSCSRTAFPKALPVSPSLLLIPLSSSCPGGRNLEEAVGTCNFSFNENCSGYFHNLVLFAPSLKNTLFVKP